MKHRLYLMAGLAAAALAVTGCKQEKPVRDASNKEVELPAGSLHLSAQWFDGELWIETLDPKSGTCTFSQYQNGKPVDATIITLKNCRAAIGGPMTRPMMPPRQGMMGRPGPMGRDGMAPPERPRREAEAPAAEAAPASPPPAE